jgi:hypothetical protein
MKKSSLGTSEFADQVAAEDGQHEASMWGRGVGPGITQRQEAGSFPCDRRQNIQEVACRPCKSIEPRHHKKISCFEMSDHAAELDPIF